MLKPASLCYFSLKRPFFFCHCRSKPVPLPLETRATAARNPCHCRSKPVPLPLETRATAARNPLLIAVVNTSKPLPQKQRQKSKQPTTTGGQSRSVYSGSLWVAVLGLELAAPLVSAGGSVGELSG